MNIQREIKTLEKTYWHMMKIERNGEVETAWGETKPDIHTIADDVKCAFSNSAGKNTTQTVSVNQIQYDGLVFCAPDTDIQAGDTVTITFENGLQRLFQAGEMQYFPSHLEVPVMREDKA